MSAKTGTVTSPQQGPPSPVGGNLQAPRPVEAGLGVVGEVRLLPGSYENSQFRIIQHPSGLPCYEDPEVLNRLDLLQNSGFTYATNLRRPDGSEVTYDQNNSFPRTAVFFDRRKKMLGLKTLVDIPLNTIIGVYYGTVISKRQLDELAEAGTSQYTVARTQTESVDGRLYGNELRFINHSCIDFNVQIYLDFGGPTGKYYFPTIKTLKNITAGEEILLNYCEEGSEISNRYFLDGKCLCGAQRHLIGNFKNKVAKRFDESTKRRKGGQFAPYKNKKNTEK